MRPLEQVVREYMLALDQALYLQTPRSQWSSTPIGLPHQITRAWARYHDLRAELTTRLEAIQTSERKIGFNPALAAPYTGDVIEGDPYQRMAFVVFHEAHQPDED